MFGIQLNSRWGRNLSFVSILDIAALEKYPQHCIHFQERLQEVAEEVPRKVVVEERNQEHRVGFVVVELQRLEPCRPGNTGRMRHIHHRLHMDLDLLGHLELHSTGRIGLRSQLLRLDFQHQVQKG